MIHVPLKSGFLAREFFQVSFGTLRSTLLQALTEGMMPLAVLFDRFTAEGFPFAVCSQVDDAQINTEGISHFLERRSRDIKRHSQVEDTVAIEQVSLPFDGIQTSFLIASHTEGNKDATRESQEGNGIQSLEAHHTGVIDERTLWLEMRLDALIPLVGFTRFTNGADSQLSILLVNRHGYPPGVHGPNKEVAFPPLPLEMAWLPGALRCERLLYHRRVWRRSRNERRVYAHQPATLERDGWGS